MINWEDLNLQLRNDIRYFLMHTQRPITVRIGKFFVLSTELFTNVSFPLKCGNISYKSKQLYTGSQALDIFRE